MRDWTIPTAVLGAHVDDPIDRWVLAIIAGHWNTSTRESHPGTRRIAEIAGVSQPTAARRLRNLVRSGDLVVLRAGHGNYATRYRVPSLESGPGTSHLEGLVQTPNESPWVNRNGGGGAERVTHYRERVTNESPMGDSEVVRDEVEQISSDVKRLGAYRDAIARGPDFSDSYALLDDGQTVAEIEPLPVATAEERDRVHDAVSGLRDALGFRRSPTRRDLA